MSTTAAGRERRLERKEIFNKYPSRNHAIFVPITAVGFTGMVTATVMSVHTLSLAEKLCFLVMMWAFAAFLITKVVTQWQREESYKDRPVIVLDADGFWHRRLGVLIPWSEVRAIRKVEEVGIVVSYIRDWFEIPNPSGYVDCNGVRFSETTLCQEMREYWTIYR